MLAEKRIGGRAANTASSDTVLFLTDRERQEIKRRLDVDRGSLAEEYDRKYLLQAFKDWKVWAHCFNFLG